MPKNETSLSWIENTIHNSEGLVHSKKTAGGFFRKGKTAHFGNLHVNVVHALNLYPPSTSSKSGKRDQEACRGWAAQMAPHLLRELLIRRAFSKILAATARTWGLGCFSPR